MDKTTTNFEQIKEQLRGALLDSPYEKFTDILAEKLWKLKDADYHNIDTFREELNKHLNLCLFLLKIKEGSIRYITGEYENKTINGEYEKKTINIETPDGLEKILEKEITEIGLDIKCHNNEYMESVVLLDKDWLYNYYTLLFPEDYQKLANSNNSLKEIINVIKDCTDEGEIVSDELKNKLIDIVTISFTPIIQKLRINEPLTQTEEEYYLVVVNRYLNSHSFWGSKYYVKRPITTDFLKEAIQALQNEKRKREKCPDIQMAKRVIAYDLFFSVKNEPIPSKPLKASECITIYKALKIMGIIVDNLDSIKGRKEIRTRPEKIISYIHKVAKSNDFMWNYTDNFIYNNMSRLKTYPFC